LLLAPEVDGSTTPLTLSERELQELRSPVPEAEILVGSAATPARLGTTPEENVSLVYVLAHGTPDVSRERPGGLQMARSSKSNGIVRAEDIEALRSAQLVFLTACEVGRAPMRRGDGGRSDLAAAFLYAGASTVVLPTCDLDLDATLRVVPGVLRELSAGAQTAEALRSVRAELVAHRDPVAALDAHLLHVVGCGTFSLPVTNDARSASTFRRVGWVLAVVAIALALWIARTSRKERASRAGIMPHGSRQN
jgi:CHAT domain-containing protein